MAKYQVIIGRAEEIDIVGIALGVPAKIDTGAYSSAIHATKIKEATVDGKKVLKFSVFGHKNSPISREMTAETYGTVDVRSSNGHSAERFWVKLKVKIANKVFFSVFTLTERSENVFPVLVGRSALSGRFIVDSARCGVKMEPLLKSFGLKVAEFEDKTK